MHFNYMAQSVLGWGPLSLVLGHIRFCSINLSVSPTNNLQYTTVKEPFLVGI